MQSEISTIKKQWEVQKYFPLFGPSVEIRYKFLSCRKKFYRVVSVEPETSNTPPGCCILIFESLHRKIKTERADALSVLMVRVSRFELEAS